MSDGKKHTFLQVDDLREVPGGVPLVVFRTEGRVFIRIPEKEASREEWLDILDGLTQCIRLKGTS